MNVFKKTKIHDIMDHWCFYRNLKPIKFGRILNYDGPCKFVGGLIGVVFDKVMNEVEDEA